MLSTLLLSIGGAVVPPLVLLFMPRKKTRALGEKLGIACSALLRVKAGKKIEEIIERTVIDFFDGFKGGLRKDNQPQK